MAHTANTDRRINEDSVKSALTNFIASYIEQNLEGVSNIRFFNMTTKILDGEKIRAVFMYSFDTPNEKGETVSTLLDGSALLVKEDSNPASNSWALEEIQVDNEVIEFKDGTVITPQTK